MITIRKLSITGVALAAIAATAGATLALSRGYTYDKHIDIVNKSRREITGLYAADAGSDKWDNDFLGWNVLPPGYHVRINLDDGDGHCRFDLKVGFSDGSTEILRDLNVCLVGKFAVKG